MDARTYGRTVWTPGGLRIQPIVIWPDRDIRATKGPSNEWRDSVYARQRCDEDGGDLTAAKVPGSEDEHPRIACTKGSDLQGTVPQFLVLGQDNPAALSYLLEPDTVFLVASEMIVVNLNDEPRVDQFRPNWLYTQRPVDEEYGPIRRLRSGWLLRSH